MESPGLNSSSLPSHRAEKERGGASLGLGSFMTSLSSKPELVAYIYIESSISPK